MLLKYNPGSISGTVPRMTLMSGGGADSTWQATMLELERQLQQAAKMEALGRLPCRTRRVSYPETPQRR